MTEIAPVEVTVQVPAAPPDVFGFFTDPARYVQWMGSQADLEPVPGGVYRVRMADGFCAAGRNACGLRGLSRCASNANGDDVGGVPVQGRAGPGHGA